MIPISTGRTARPRARRTRALRLRTSGRATALTANNRVVALAEAWDSRPPGFQRSTLRRIAEDHDNLTLATASANRSKSDRDPAEWRPEYNGAWMAHRVVEVKQEYDLSVDPQERDWLERLLGSGSDEITCGQAGSADPDHPPVRTYQNCAPCATQDGTEA